MEQNKRQGANTFWGFILLLFVLGLSLWMFQQYNVKYENLQATQRILLTSLDRQTDMMSEYQRELDLVKANLAETESLLSNVQKENEKLYQKIALLDEVSELENTISRLKVKNSHLVNMMSSRREEFPRFTKDIKTIKEARAFLSKARMKVTEFKMRIGELKGEQRDQKIAAQKEEDELWLKLGNNGYIIRDGELTPVEVTLPPSKKQIKIDVTFVK